MISVNRLAGLILIVILLLFGLRIVQLYSIRVNGGDSKNVKQFPENLQVKIVDENSALVKMGSFGNGTRKIMVILYDPNCSDCDELITSFKRHQSELKNVSVLMLSTGNCEHTANFIKFHNFNGRYIKWLIAPYELSYYSFEFTALPTVYLFDKDGFLIKKISKNISIMNILSLLKD